MRQRKPASKLPNQQVFQLQFWRILEQIDLRIVRCWSCIWHSCIRYTGVEFQAGIQKPLKGREGYEAPFQLFTTFLKSVACTLWSPTVELFKTLCVLVRRVSSSFEAGLLLSKTHLFVRCLCFHLCKFFLPTAFSKILPSRVPKLTLTSNKCSSHETTFYK